MELNAVNQSDRLDLLVISSAMQHLSPKTWAANGRGATSSPSMSTASGKVLVRAVNSEIDSLISSTGPRVASYAEYCEANGLPRVKLYDLVRECPPLKIRKAASATSKSSAFETNGEDAE